MSSECMRSLSEYARLARANRIAFDTAARAGLRSNAEFATMMIAADAINPESKAALEELEKHRRTHARVFIQAKKLLRIHAHFVHALEHSMAHWGWFSLVCAGRCRDSAEATSEGRGCCETR
jgi:hypothetical protein